MNNSLILMDEPQLEFGYDQRACDPRDGLSLFGPYDSGIAKPISYILIGTTEGINKFRTWSSLLSNPAVDAPKGNQRLWAPFPGYNASFGVDWPLEPLWLYSVDKINLIQASENQDKYERAYKVVNKFLEGIKIASQKDERIGVAICVVPDHVWQNCRPKSIIRNSAEQVSTKRIKSRKTGQLELFDSYDVEQYFMSTDFRRQLKARGMEYDFPIQIVRESTLRPDSINKFGQRGLTPLSDRLWNMSTTLYYKCGGKPWKLSTAREGVCYIGIAFKRVEEESNTACCAAQMFLNTGDGVVFLGKFGPWYSPEDNQFHLTKKSARNLVEGVLKTYAEQGGKPLTEVFIHSRSNISQEEFDGYQEACPANITIIGVRVRMDDDKTHIYRNGRLPVLRGTFLKINDRSCFLWGSGFKPRLATYDGWDVPLPLRIDIEHGDQTSIERVAQDILSLTKLNYNACRLGDSEPVTVKFSNAVGEILVSNPLISRKKPNFKYYI